MKKITSLIASVAFAVLAMGSLVAPASAKNLDQMWAETLDAQNNAVNVSSGASSCVTLFYAGSSSESVVAITSFSIIAIIPSGPDTAFGTGTPYSGGYDLTAVAFNNMGKLVTAINNATATSKYSAQLQGCKFDDNSNLMRDQVQTANSNTPISIGGYLQAANLGGAAGYTVYQDTGGISAAGSLGSTATFVTSLGINPAAGRRVTLIQCKENTAGTGTFSVFGKLRKFDGAADNVTRNSSTLVWQESTVANTAQTTTWAVSGAPGSGLDFGVGAQVVVRAGDGATSTAATGFLQCEWQEK